MTKQTKEQAIKTARACVERNHCCKPGERRWLVGNPPDSYSERFSDQRNEGYRTELHVLEGTPVKGALLAVGELDGGTVVAFSAGLKKIGTWRWDNPSEGRKA